jgi:hypothetical protein
MAEALEVQVVFPYTASDKNQLTLTPGERITVVQASNRGWWIGAKEDGSMGLFPSAYCKPIERTQSFAVPLEQKTLQLAAGNPSPLNGVSLVSSAMSSPNESSRQQSRMNAQKIRDQLGLGGEEEGGFGPRPTSAKHDRLVETVSNLRRLRAAVESDVNCINNAGKTIAASLAQRGGEQRHVVDQRQSLVASIQQMDAELTDLLKINEVLRCAFMDEPLPEYVPRGSSTSPPPAAGNGEQTPLVEEEGDEVDAADDAPAAGPSSTIKSPDDIEDAKLKKTALKLLKRVDEAKEVEEGYEKKLRKLEKKIAKAQAAAKDHEENTTGQRAAQQAAMSAAETAAVAKLAEAKAELDAQLARLDQLDLEAQAAEKTRAKAAKKVAKGDAALQELRAELAHIATLKTSSGAMVAAAQSEVAHLRAALAAAEDEVRAAERLQEAAKAEEAANGSDLARRVEKEKTRIAEYRSAIAAIKAAEGRPSGASTPTPGP